MTLLDMQRVLSRILTDKAFALALDAGLRSVTDDYVLSDRELRSLRGMRWDRVHQQVEFLAHDRLEMGLKGMPLSRLVLGTQLHGHLERFCVEHPPVPQPDGLVSVECDRLCAFALRLLANGAMEPAWATTVVAYERIMLTLLTSESAAASAVAAADDRYPGRASADLPGLVPVAGVHTRVASFDHPLPELIEQLDAGVVPAEVSRLARPLLVLFHRTSPGGVRTARINAATAVLVDACDGTRTVADVVALLRYRLGDAIADGTTAALDRLRASGVVHLEEGT